MLVDRRAPVAARRHDTPADGGGRRPRPGRRDERRGPLPRPPVRPDRRRAGARNSGGCRAARAGVRGGDPRGAGARALHGTTGGRALGGPRGSRARRRRIDGTRVPCRGGAHARRSAPHGRPSVGTRRHRVRPRRAGDRAGRRPPRRARGANRRFARLPGRLPAVRRDGPRRGRRRPRPPRGRRTVRRAGPPRGGGARDRPRARALRPGHRELGGPPPEGRRRHGRSRPAINDGLV